MNSVYKVDVGHRAHEADAGIRRITPRMFGFVSFVACVDAAVISARPWRQQAVSRSVALKLVDGGFCRVPPIYDPCN